MKILKFCTDKNCNCFSVLGNKGVVYVVKLPLLEKAEFTEFSMHNQTVTKVNKSSIYVKISFI